MYAINFKLTIEQNITNLQGTQKGELLEGIFAVFGTKKPSLKEVCKHFAFDSETDKDLMIFMVSAVRLLHGAEGVSQMYLDFFCNKFKEKFPFIHPEITDKQTKEFIFSASNHSEELDKIIELFSDYLQANGLCEVEL